MARVNHGKSETKAMAAAASQPIAKMQESFADGASPVAVVENCLEQIEQTNDTYRAMIFVGRQEALDAAKRAETEIRSGRRKSLLHGIPIAVKDVIDVRGWPTTSGSRLFQGFVAEEDAACVASLRDAGAIIIGKTNLHEMTAGGNDNPWHGKVVNPLDPARGTGGTSSGSAAAVAAGYCAAALGTDTGGSNRSTAAATGLVGFKPVSGAIDRAGVRPTAPSFDAIGPIAATVEDAWLVHAALRGLAPPGLGAAGPSGLRIGLCPELHHAAIDPVLAQAHDAWLRAAVDAGASIVPLGFPFGEQVREAGRIILLQEFAAHYGQLVEKNPERVGADVRAFVSDGLAIDRDAYEGALAFRKEARDGFRDLLATVDLLATPVTPGLAPCLSDETTKVGSAFVPYGLAGGTFRRWANFLDVPTLAMPIPTVGDLPASIQLSALPGMEENLFAICKGLSLLDPG